MGSSCSPDAGKDCRSSSVSVACMFRLADLANVSSQRYQKLKKLADDGAVASTESAPTAQTPKSAKGKGKDAAKRKIADDNEDGNANIDGDLDAVKPTPKKRASKKAKKDVKVEEDDEADVETGATPATADAKDAEEDDTYVESLLLTGPLNYLY